MAKKREKKQRTRAKSNLQKVFELLESSSGYVFCVEEIALFTELSHKQVHKALEKLKERGKVTAYNDPYSGKANKTRGRRKKYYGVVIDANTKMDGRRKLETR